MKRTACLVFVLLSLAGGGLAAEKNDPVTYAGVELAMEHYRLTEAGRPILDTWPEEGFRSSPTEIVFESAIHSIEDLKALLASRPEKLKLRDKVEATLNQKGFFIVVIQPTMGCAPDDGAEEGKRLREAYLIPKGGKHLVYWVYW